MALLNKWLTEEHQSGAPKPQQAVLATCAKDAIPHARVVAIREFDAQSLLFFTQRGTRKVKEIFENPFASMTFWFEVLQCEVIIEGAATALTESENLKYWKSYPREAQIRFHSYAPTLSQPIISKDVLEIKMREIANDYIGKDIPLCTPIIVDLDCGTVIYGK